eukprot:SAG31_NODE_7582_length_1648_cov_1.127179_1_plen_50_part_10
MAAQRQETPPSEVITAEQLASLERRLETLHAGSMLSDEELFSLEDLIADY